MKWYKTTTWHAKLDSIRFARISKTEERYAVVLSEEEVYLGFGDDVGSRWIFRGSAETLKEAKELVKAVYKKALDEQWE